MEQKKSLKEFVKEHKGEIIFGGLCLLGGVYIGKKKCGLTKSEKTLVKNLRGVDPVFKGDILTHDINKMFKGSNLVNTFAPTDTKSVHDLANYIKDVYDLKDSKTEALGMIVFSK